MEDNAGGSGPGTRYTGGIEISGRDSPIGSARRDAGDHAEAAARRASLWVEKLARFGYAAKGVVYIVMGVLAVLAAAGARGGRRTRTARSG